MDTGYHFWLVRLKPDLIQPTTDKTSLPQPKTDDISFDKSLLLQCGGIHGHYVPLVVVVFRWSVLRMTSAVNGYAIDFTWTM